MSLDIPTTAELRANIISGLESSLGQTIPILPKAFLRVLSTVLAGVLVTEYKYGGFIFLQMFVSTASLQSVTVNGKTVSPLTEWGRLVGLGDPTPATAAEMDLTIDVLNQVGTLPSGTQLLHGASGVVYLSTAAIALDAATKTVPVIAANDQSGGGGLGTIGNRVVGETLSFVSPIPDVSPNATVATITTTGADAETEDAYRIRVLDRFQKRPQGGAYADYEQWGEEVAGVANIYPYTGAPGEVDVYVESATEVDGIPTQAQLDAVAASIELDDNGLASRRPAYAFVNTLPITRVSYDVEVNGLIVDDVVQTQADINDALTEFFIGREPFIEGLSIPPRVDQISQTGVAGVVEDIATAAGGIVVSVRVERDGVGVGLQVLSEGEKCKLGVLTYT